MTADCDKVLIGHGGRRFGDQKDETRENPRPHAVRHYTATEIAQMWNFVR